jgi:hypothetical protein
VELRRSFVDDEDDPKEKSPSLLEFWASVEGKNVRKGKDEPGGKIGELRFASNDLLSRSGHARWLTTRTQVQGRYTEAQSECVQAPCSGLPQGQE